MNNMSHSTWKLHVEIAFYTEPDDLDKAAELTSELLVETVGKSRIPPSNAQKIKRSLAASLVNARNLSIQGGSRVPLLIEVYSQASDREISPRPARGETATLTQEQIDSAPDIIPLTRRNAHANDQFHQGWGHFLVGRMAKKDGLSGETDHYFIEIFFYSESNAG
jgi:hypothetical protein